MLASSFVKCFNIAPATPAEREIPASQWTRISKPLFCLIKVAIFLPSDTHQIRNISFTSVHIWSWTVSICKAQFQDRLNPVLGRRKRCVLIYHVRIRDRYHDCFHFMRFIAVDDSISSTHNYHSQILTLFQRLFWCALWELNPCPTD